jgi:hypothetical protein
MATPIFDSLHSMCQAKKLAARDVIAFSAELKASD